MRLQAAYVRTRTGLDKAPIFENEASSLVKDQNRDKNLVVFYTDLGQAIEQGDMVIDFSSPELSLQALNYCVQENKPMVIGTTGFTASQIVLIKDAGEKIPILLTNNTSVGMNLMFALVELCAQTLKNDGNWQARILEMHHVHKKDIPSGTAKHLAELLANLFVANEFSDNNLQKKTKPKASDGGGIYSLRANEIVGEHQVFLFGEQERLEIVHRAQSRDIFVNGALLAASLLYRHKKDIPGLYSMSELLGFNNSTH